MKITSKFSVFDIVQSINCQSKIIGNPENKFVDSINSINEADENTLVFIDHLRRDKKELAIKTRALIILCDDLDFEIDNLIENKCLIVVSNPKLAFIRFAKKYFTPKIEYSIHHSAVIHPEAEIDENVFIGAHTYIGKCKIKSNTIIHGNCYIYDDVKIGRNVIIHAGTVIGVDALGHVKNENNEYEVFPQLGGVFIGDDVEIGACCVIDKGTFGDTTISKGTKLNSQVYVGHNSYVGEHSLLVFAFLAGSTKIGNHSYLAPSVTVINSVSVGNNSFVGTGSVVTKDVPDNETWVGVPAKPIKDFLRIKDFLNSVIYE